MTRTKTDSRKDIPAARGPELLDERELAQVAGGGILGDILDFAGQMLLARIPRMR